MLIETSHSLISVHSLGSLIHSDATATEAKEHIATKRLNTNDINNFFINRAFLIIVSFRY